MNPTRRLSASIEYLEKRIAPATIFVTTTADAGDGSLRKAIADANATPAADTILFKPSAFGTIVLTSGDLDITTPINITGPGAGKVTISGNNTSRIFNIDDADPGKLSPVILSGLAFINGNATGDGSTIESTETLSVIKCILSGNTASLDGGAIHAKSNGKFLMTGSTVTGNTADRGGGLYLDVANGITIMNSTISGNAATVSKGGGAHLSMNGGAIPTAKVLIQKTSFVGNTSLTNGGGLSLSLDGRAASVINSTFAGNITSGVGGVGGGIFMTVGTFVLQGCTVSANFSFAGGGIHFAGSPGTTGTIKTSRILNNTATDNAGGGILFDADGTATSALNILGSTIAGNAARNGGGIAATEGGKLSLTATAVTGNRASIGGGGVFTDGTGLGTVTLGITGGTITDNIASGNGGGINTAGGGPVTIKGAKITGNRAGDLGGGAYLISAGNITITSTLISKNSARDDGGGAVILGTTTILTGLTVTDNVAGDIVGGISFSTGTITLTKSLIRGNHAEGVGGGIGIFGGTLSIATSIITGNVSNDSGGGIQRAVGIVTLAPTAKVFGNIAPLFPDKNF